MKKSTKYKIYFLVLIPVLFWNLVIDPLTWDKKYEKNVIMENPIVKRPFNNKRSSVDRLVFTNQIDGTRYSINCSYLKIDKKENFCDWYDGKNLNHKVSGIQKVSIIYLDKGITVNQKHKKLKTFAFVNNIEFLDNNNNVHHFIIKKEVIYDKIKRYLSGMWGVIIALFILFFPDVSEKILSGNKEKMKTNRNYEQLIALRGFVISIIIFILSILLTREIVNLIF